LFNFLFSFVLKITLHLNYLNDIVSENKYINTGDNKSNELHYKFINLLMLLSRKKITDPLNDEDEGILPS
jgi:hypothetical protein